MKPFFRVHISLVHLHACGMYNQLTILIVPHTMYFITIRIHPPQPSTPKPMFIVMGALMARFRGHVVN